jgi:PilZ domain-containing protein
VDERPKSRRSDRISIELPIQVVGADAMGQQFIEPAHTLLISRHGALIVVKRRLVPEEEMTIVNTQLHNEADVRVIGHVQTRPDGEVYGVALLDSSKDLWHVEFPPLSEAEKALARSLLECSGCHKREVFYFNEVDLEVFGVKQELIRQCKSCGVATMWRYVGGTPKTPETPAEVAEAKPQPEQKPEPAPDERRRHPRARVNLLACLSTNGLEDIVQCEDVSRGGFCFVSEMCYPVGLNTEAAMPYSKTGGNIFVPSRIAHSRELPDGHFRHGVAYKPTRQ